MSLGFTFIFVFTILVCACYHLIAIAQQAIGKTIQGPLNPQKTTAQLNICETTQGPLNSMVV